MESKRKQIKQILRIARQPYRTDFFELVRNFEKACPGRLPTGCADSVVDEPIRFSQRPSLRFYGNNLSKVEEGPTDRYVVHIETFGPGLTGVDGPMPLDFTAKVFQLSNNQYDFALQRFLDIINHRYLALFYRAYAQNSMAINYDRHEKDEHRNIMRSLSGAASVEPQKFPPFTAESMAPYTMSRACGVSGLLAALTSFFGYEIEIETSIFEAYQIPNELHCLLGRNNSSVLGLNAQIGTHYYSHTKKFIMKMGPIKFRDCQRLLPGTKDYDNLNKIITFYLEKPQEYDLVFILRRNSMEKICLNGSFALGRSTFLIYRNQQGLCNLTINASRLQSNKQHYKENIDA